MLNELYANPMFGVAATILAFAAGKWVNDRLNTPLANPLLIAVLMLITAHWLAGVPYESYYQGGQLFTMLMPPATASLAVLIYRQRAILKHAFFPVVTGCLAGTAASMLATYYLCKAFGIDDVVTHSFLPKSVTTPIAVELAPQTGGVPALTIAVVVVTGMVGVLLLPYLLRIFRLKNPIAVGVGIGTSSHVIGTSRAVLMGETEGAISSISIGVAGLQTAIFYLFL